MPLRDLLHPRRIQECFSGCPPVISTYAAMHLDSLNKIISHLLVATMVFDILMFLSAWSVTILPSVGFSAVFTALLLTAQTACVWFIINPEAGVPSLALFTPSEFMIGVAFGLTVGGCILSHTVAAVYSQASNCVAPSSAAAAAAASSSSSTTAPVTISVCQKDGNVGGVWLWSSLISLFSLLTALFLAVGRNELSRQTHLYQDISGSQNSDNNSMNNSGYQGGGGGGGGMPTSGGGAPSFAGDMMPTATSSFVGDYATVPEIRATQSGKNPSVTNV